MMRVVREFPPSDSGSQLLQRMWRSQLTLQNTSKFRISIRYMC
jgi:hypothetical protein